QNKINGDGASQFVAILKELNELKTLKFYILDDQNLIDEINYTYMAQHISNFPQLKTLTLGFINYENFLQQSEIINCRNIKILNLYVKQDLEIIMVKSKTLAQKIKRLVKLNIQSHI
ncbi:hypothetical protein ABPG72_009281, partial [Tetrahymena utriculariae]